MITHYLSTAFRHFRRHRVTAAINIACLALGLTCFIVIYAVIDNYDRADRHFAKSARTYVITQRIQWAGRDATGPTSPNSTWPVADYLRTDVPELDTVVRVSKGRELPAVAGERREFLAVAFSDARFFRVFDFAFSTGDAARALASPRSIVLTQAAAQRLFGSRPALGESVLLGNSERVYVTGVLAPFQTPSHMTEANGAGIKPQNFEALVSEDVFVSMSEARGESRASLEQWTNNNAYYTYAVLPAGGSFSVTQLNERLRALSRHVPREQGSSTFAAQPMSKIFELSLNMVMGTDLTGISSMQLLSVLGLLVVLVSCLNYANLATAQAATRNKEMALARTLGARGVHVIAQTFMESLVATAIALGIALIAATVFGPLLTFEKSSTATLARSLVFWRDVLLVLFGVSALACAYPAIVQARIRPAGALRSGQRRATGRLTMTLVAAQFAAASLLLICVLVMRAQNRELEARVLTLSSDPIVVLTTDHVQAGLDRDVLRAELERDPAIRWVTGTANEPWSLNINAELLASAETAASRRFRVWREVVDYDYFAPLGLDVLAGRTFDERQGDATRAVVVIDAALAAQYGWQPAEALGKQIYTPLSGDPGAGTKPSEVIGVVAAKPLQSLGLGLSSTLYRLDPARADVLLIGIDKRNVARGLAAIDGVWTRLASSTPVKRRFMDEQFERTYRVFAGFVAMFQALALFAFAISVVGLVGMALHLANRRTHEIGVRKTLGASAGRILAMLLRDFSKPVLFANLAVWPLAFVAMQLYLNAFIQRTELTGTPFVASLLITLAIACLAVVAQATRAARMSPARVLRHE
jgi:putative ABC transport system permease protein